MNRNDAIQVINTILSAKYRGTPYDMAVIENDVIETEYGWILHWYTRRFAETGEDPDPMGGGGPAIVDRNGNVQFCGSANPEGDIMAFEMAHGYPVRRHNLWG